MSTFSINKLIISKYLLVCHYPRIVTSTWFWLGVKPYRMNSIYLHRRQPCPNWYIFRIPFFKPEKFNFHRYWGVSISNRSKHSRKLEKLGLKLSQKVTFRVYCFSWLNLKQNPWLFCIACFCTTGNSTRSIGVAGDFVENTADRSNRPKQTRKNAVFEEF